jgi:hypothetical protein
LDKEYLGDDPKNTALMKDTPLASKYNSGFTYAPRLRKIIPTPSINFLRSIADNQRYLKMDYSKSKSERYDILLMRKWF